MKLASQGHIRDILFPSSAPFAHTHLQSLYTFLVSVVIASFMLIAKDLELGLRDGKEHAMFVFLGIGYYTQYNFSRPPIYQ